MKLNQEEKWEHEVWVSAGETVMLLDNLNSYALNADTTSIVLSSTVQHDMKFILSTSTDPWDTGNAQIFW